MPLPKDGLRKVHCLQCQALIAVRKDGTVYKHECNSGADITCKGPCGRVLSPDEFYKDVSRPRGRLARCKQCYATQQATVTRMKPYRREQEAKRGAIKRGLSYNLTREQFMSFWQMPCSYCGDSIDTIGIDRVDNAKGYEMDNVVSCCGVCNHAKAKMDAEEYRALCARVTAHSAKTANASIACEGK